MKFSDYQLDDKLSKALEECGYVEPTEVQSLAIPRLLKGVDLVVSSKTGSGKTAAFLLPILHKLSNGDKIADKTSKKPSPRVFIISPTRELSIQIYEDFLKFSKYLDIKGICVYGQHNIEREKKSLNKNPEIVCATPGRLIDHIKSGNINCSDVTYLVLDEADKMLEMGFIDQVKEIIKNISKNRQTMLFSATMPAEIQKIGTRYMKSPEKIVIKSKTKTVDYIDQSYIEVQRDRKNTTLYNLLVYERPNSVVIFCNTRNMVDRLAQFLTVRKFRVSKLHGGISQSARTKTIEKFKNHKFKILIATDVAARGIHVDDLSMVINYDLPEDKDNYIHRIGRTGRAGKNGKSISFVSSGDLFNFYDIEEHVGVRIPVMELPSEKIINNFLNDARKLYRHAELERQLEIEKKNKSEKKSDDNTDYKNNSSSKKKSNHRNKRNRNDKNYRNDKKTSIDNAKNDFENKISDKKSQKSKSKYKKYDGKTNRSEKNSENNNFKSDGNKNANKSKRKSKINSENIKTSENYVKRHNNEQKNEFQKISELKKVEIIENYKKNKKNSKQSKGFSKWLSKMFGK